MDSQQFDDARREMEMQGLLYPPQQTMKNDSRADLLDKIKPELVIESIKQQLMGNEWDDNQGKWVKNVLLEKYSLTPLGAVTLTNLIFPASTQNVALSNLDDDEIKKRLVSIVETAMKMCLDYWQEFGITSCAQFYFIKEIIYTNTLVALKQPEREGIRRLLTSTMTENRNVSTIGEEKSGGFLSFLKKTRK